MLLAGAAIVASDADPESHLYGLYLKSGTCRWKLPFAHGTATTPLFVDDKVIAVSAQGTVAAIEPASGDIAWKVSPAGPLQPQPFIPSPASIEDRVFFADNLGAVFSLDASNGKTMWVKKLSDRSSTALATAGGNVVVGTIDGYMNWIDPGSGDVVKRVRLDGHPYGTPVVASGRLLVLVGGPHWKLLSLDSRKGTTIWRKDSETEWSTYRPLLMESLVIV